MTPNMPTSRDQLLQAVFSDDPAPEIHAVVVVAHSGDECLGASWLLSRLFDRASVFRLTRRDQPDFENTITLTGLPAERCHDLGLTAGTLANDLESLTWLISAAVKPLEPRLLITHACEGVNLDHDAVAFAVQMTALMLPRFGGVPPVILEFQCHHDGDPVHHDAAAPFWEQGVRVDFGPDSRNLKQQILESQLGSMAAVHPSALSAEIYRPQHTSGIAPTLQSSTRRYLDVPGFSGAEFHETAAAVARGFAQNGLIAAAI